MILGGVDDGELVGSGWVTRSTDLIRSEKWELCLIGRSLILDLEHSDDDEIFYDNAKESEPPHMISQKGVHCSIRLHSSYKTPTSQNEETFQKHSIYLYKQ